eukprot:5828403-Lingulodinium_polyedra.AAC.1
MRNADVIEARGFTSWNTRWMVGPNSEKTTDKKAVVQTGGCWNGGTPSGNPLDACYCRHVGIWGLPAHCC